MTKMFVSSANNTSSLAVPRALQMLLKSLMYMRNKRGPKQLPWGTPYAIGSFADSSPNMLTYWVLPVRYDFKRLWATPRIP